MVSWREIVYPLLGLVSLWYLKSWFENFARGQNDKIVAEFQAQLDKQRDAARHNLELVLAGVTGEQARLTDEARLYLTNQHEAYARVYRLLHRAHDAYRLCLDHGGGYDPNISKFSADELDAAMKADKLPLFKRKEVLTLWATGDWRQALHVLDEYEPLHRYQQATRVVQRATNAFLRCRLYFSDEVSSAADTLLNELRRYDWKVEYGRQRVGTDELEKAQASLRLHLDTVYIVMRGDLRRPVQGGRPVQEEPS